MLPTSDRRSFLAALATISGGAALTVGSGARGALAEVTREPAPHTAWDLSWIDQLRGKHKQVFDVSSSDATPLLIVTNYLDAHLEVYGLAHPRVNAVVGIARGGFPLNAGDALWSRYELGRRWEVKDPASGAWATHNIFLDGTAMGGKSIGIRPLVARGVVFWQCNNALNFIVHQLATDTNQPADDVRAELVAGLNPGVHIVPAHTFALGLVQEHGCTYQKV